MSHFVLVLLIIVFIYWNELYFLERWIIYAIY